MGFRRLDQIAAACQRRHLADRSTTPSPVGKEEVVSVAPSPLRLSEFARLVPAGPFPSLASKRVRRCNKRWISIGQAEMMSRGHMHEVASCDMTNENRVSVIKDRVPVYSNGSFLVSNSYNAAKGGGIVGEMVACGIFDTQSVFPIGVCPPTSTTRPLDTSTAHQRGSGFLPNSATIVAELIAEYLKNHRTIHRECATWVRDLKRIRAEMRRHCGSGGSPTSPEYKWVCDEYVELVEGLASQRRATLQRLNRSADTTIDEAASLLPINATDLSYYALLADKKLISSIVSHQKEALSQYRDVTAERRQQLSQAQTRLALCQKMLDDAVDSGSPSIVIERLRAKHADAEGALKESRRVLERAQLKDDDTLKHVAFNSQREGCSGLWLAITAKEANESTGKCAADLSVCNSGNSRAFVIRRELLDQYWLMMLGDWADLRKFGSLWEGGRPEVRWSDYRQAGAKPGPGTHTPAVEGAHPPLPQHGTDSSGTHKSAIGMTSAYVAAHDPKLTNLLSHFRTRAVLPLTRDLCPENDDERVRINVAASGAANEMHFFTQNRSSSKDYESLYSQQDGVANTKYNCLMGEPPLAVTRGFGFPTYKANLRSTQKQQIVIADPQVGTVALEEGDIFIVANRALFEGVAVYKDLMNALRDDPAAPPAMAKVSSSTIDNKTLRISEVVIRVSPPSINVDELLSAVVDSILERMADALASHVLNDCSEGDAPSLESCLKTVDMGEVASQCLSKMAKHASPKHLHLAVGRVGVYPANSDSDEIKTAREIGPIRPSQVASSPLAHALLTEEAKWLYGRCGWVSKADEDRLVADMLRERWAALAKQLMGTLTSASLPPRKVCALLRKAQPSNAIGNTPVVNPTSSVFSPLRWMLRTSVGPLYSQEAEKILDAVEEEWVFFKGGPPSFWTVALPHGMVACPDPSAYEGLVEEDDAYFVALARSLRSEV